MSSSVNESNLEKKFLAVTNTQDSIQTLSLWILHHRAHHKKIVDIWMKVLKKAKINHRLTLFYLANDVVQNGKRKGYPQFGEAFQEVLREATLLVRSEKIRSSVERVFNIWGQRNVYGSSFISELQAILVNSKVPKSAPSKLLTEFKHENVINKIRQVLSLEIETAAKTSSLNISKLDATKAEILQQLKDRSHGQRFSCDFDEATNCLEDVIECLEKEVKQRAQLILLLEQSEIYYDSQRGEAKIVANAYKNFGSKVKALQKKLDELKNTFPSPIPSPCMDAPSPANSDPEADTDLPNAKREPDDSDSFDNAPSPEGSPEGLALTPPHSEKATQENNVGNPIPTLSNFFPQASGIMSSWLDAFSSSSKNSTPVINSPTADTKKADPSSLDSRLSNLMQNIPNLSGGLQSSLFGGSSSGGLTPVRDVNTPPPYEKDETPAARNVREVTTPVKDECSGQNTPLQDEDIHSSNHSGFFNPPATSSKTSQSSKDVLKGLTNLIQTVTSATAEKPDYDPKQNISEFIKKIAPSLTHLSPHSSSSPIAFLNSPQNTFVSQPNENVHSSPRPTLITSPNPSHSFSNSSYSPSQMDPYSGSTSSPTKAMHENLSFIPTLVPSTPHDGSFDFTADEFPADEYNPETENYLPMENEDDLCPVDTPSPTLLEETCESPDDLSDEDDIPQNISNQRQSTLITLVADEKMSTPTVDHGSQSSEDSMSHPEESEYLSPHHDVLQGTDVIQNPVNDAWPPVEMQADEEGGLVHSQENLTVPEPTLTSETFIGDHDERQNLFSPVVPPPISEPGPLNGSCETWFAPPGTSETTLVSYPLSQIETVQSFRNDVDNRWFGNDWGGGFHGQRHNMFHGNEQRSNFNRRPYKQRGDYSFRRGGPKPNFRQRNNWQPRERHFNENEQGSPYPKRFAPFPGRGRGWRNNNYHQQ